MSRAGRSLLIFGIYLLVLGGALIVAPNVILRLLVVQETEEVWIRVLGVILVYVGTYYIQAARHELTALFRASIPVRLSLIAFLVVFVALGYANPVVIAFGVADLAGAMWTAVVIRRDAARGYGGPRARSR